MIANTTNTVPLWAGTLALVLATPIHLGAAQVARSTRQIAADIGSNEVRKLVVLQYPERAGTFKSVTPADINRYYQFRTEVRVLPVWYRTAELKAVLAEPNQHAYTVAPGDFRWGCLFYDRGNHLLHSIYINPLVSTCLVDGRPSALPPRLLPWLRTVFGSELQRFGASR